MLRRLIIPSSWRRRHKLIRRRRKRRRSDPANRHLDRSCLKCNRRRLSQVKASHRHSSNCKSANSGNVRCSRRRHRRDSSNRYSRRLPYSSGRSSRPHRVGSLYQFRSSNNEAAGVPRSNRRRVRLRLSSRSDSPLLRRPRCNCRLRRPDHRRHKYNVPLCRRRLRITRGVLMMCAAPAARCARVTDS